MVFTRRGGIINMTKLQMIKRANGSVSFSVNIPLAMLKDMGWEKGENLSFEIAKMRDRDVLIISRDEVNNG